MRFVDEIIVHCAAVPPDWKKGRSTADKVASMRRWHVEDNRWSDIGYHFVIDRDGTVAAGRPIEKAGAHTRGRNSKSVGICLIGGAWSNEHDDFFQNFTLEQDTALRDLIGTLKRKYPTIKTVSGHNQYAAKACPGFNVANWLAQERPVQPKPTIKPPQLSQSSDPIAAFFKRIFGGKKWTS